MAKIFISYSKKDKHMVQQIAGPLTSLGHQLLYDDVMLAPNSSVDEALDAALKDADGVIFIFTENSVHSRNVMKEYGAAESLVADKSKFLIPIVSGSPELPDFIKRKQYLTYEDPDLISKIQSTIMASGAGIKPSPISIEKDPIPLAKGPGPTIRKERSSNPSSTKYWFLKINPETWDILDFETYFKDQSEALFGTHNLNNNQRVDYQLFFQVKKGDKAIGYAFGDKKAIECVFEITEGVHVRKEVGEVISLRFEKIISPPIPLDFFSDKIDFADKLSAEAPERIFQISPMMFNSLLASDNLSYITRDMTITNYTTEGDHKQTEDQLSFSADVMSFATVICLKKVKPPLAIGLFGKWGAGKSFFMEKLTEQIDRLSLTKDERYINNVVQVKFNSWHYSDANLWASLITEIFDSLNVYAKNEDEYNEIEKLSATLQLTSLHKEESERKKKELQDKVVELKQKQKKKREELEDISGLSLLKLAFSDPKIRDDIGQLNNDGIQSIKDNQEKLEGYINDATSVGNQFYLFFKELVNLKGRRWWWVIGLAITVFILTYLVKSLFSHQWEDFSFWLSFKFGLGVTAIGKALEAALSYRKMLSKITGRWKSLKKTLEARPLEGDAELDENEKTLLQVTASLNELDKKILQTKKQIEDISTGKKLLEFIDNRSRDEGYSKQLGLIAWIRKDFQTLDKLLREQHQVGENEKSKIENPENVKLKIDRIVLYIDDLDRCNEDIVVKVLEAIHLLLAFPLFVVVVGVDPRWLNNALNKKYEKLFNAKEGHEKSESITSYDYLEKIFQIPFALKEASKTDRQRLLGYLMREELEGKQQAKTTVAETPQVPIQERTPEANGTQKTEPVKMEIEEEKQVLANVNFGEDEINYMRSISAMFGSTPRMMNRYVNIYRIIKSHKNYQVAQVPSARDFKSTMFVLGVIIGCPVFAREFVERLTSTKEESMIKFIQSLKTKELKTFITENTDKNVVGDLTTTIVKKNLPLISRFSFRTYDV